MKTVLFGLINENGLQSPVTDTPYISNSWVVLFFFFGQLLFFWSTMGCAFSSISPCQENTTTVYVKKSFNKSVFLHLIYIFKKNIYRYYFNPKSHNLVSVTNSILTKKILSQSITLQFSHSLNPVRSSNPIFKILRNMLPCSENEYYVLLRIGVN